MTPPPTGGGTAVARSRAWDAVVERLEASVHTVPTDAAEADGTLAWDSTTMVLVRVGSGEHTGIGWTYGPPACSYVVRDKLAGVVLGTDALDVGRAFVGMVAAIRNDSRPGVAGYALSAVDVALWDLKARLLGLPLHRLLGAVRDEVPVYGSGGFTTYDADRLHDQLTGWAAVQRIPRVKIKIGGSWGNRTDRDLARIAQARAVV